MKIAKSIDDIYNEVKGYDKVITNDAPLATALNARIDIPKLGGFAYTPRQIASMVSGKKLERPAMDDLEVVKAVMDETGYSFRFVHSTIKTIRDIRKYKAEVKENLHSKREKEVLRSFLKLPTRDLVMATYDPTGNDDFYKDQRIAVIGLDMMDDLDKHFLPMDFDEVDLFTGGEFSIDRIYAVGNDRQIADNIVDLIGKERCMDTAIVLDSKSALADAVRAALYRNKIPFKNSMTVKDLTQVRDFIQFLTLALDYRTLRVRDVRELFSAYGMGVSRGFSASMDGYLLSKAPDVDDRRARSLMKTMEGIRGMTFRQAVDAVHDFEGNRSIQRQKASVAILIEDLGLGDTVVDREQVSFLNYAVNNVDDLRHNEQIPEDERAGVLLADCKNSVYVDRPFVLFLGLDQNWDVGAAGRDYVDPQDLEEKNALRLSILLQQGTFRIYAVKPVTKGKPTVPAMTFGAMGGMKRSLTCFEDICTDIVRGPWYESAPGPSEERGSMGSKDLDDIWKFSKTEYNAYVDCPLKFLFHKVLPSSESDSIVFGNVLHNFAELYFCHPEVVREKGVDHFIDTMTEVYSGISNECHRDVDKSRIRVYMNNLIRYIDHIRPADVPLDRDEKDRQYRNPLFEAEGLDRCSTMAESELGSRHHLFAKYDLLLGNTIVDYKTGKVKTPDDIISALKGDGKNDSDFQSLIYMQALLDNGRKAPLKFDLFFMGDNDVDSVRFGDFDISRNVKHVIVDSRSKVEIAIDSVYANIKTTKKYSVAVSRWSEVSSALKELEPWDENQTQALANVIGSKSAAVNAAEGILSKMTKAMGKTANVLGNDTVVLSLDELETFIDRLEEDYPKACLALNRSFYSTGRGKISCDRCEYRNACMQERVGLPENEEVKE
ncbi:MAG: PD-(D/E)XK nuclease family protein [archaeon]|nr:PD-(D/E)XK nuclease family protein [archaeon]